MDLNTGLHQRTRQNGPGKWSQMLINKLLFTEPGFVFAYAGTEVPITRPVACKRIPRHKGLTLNSWKWTILR